MKNTVYAVIAFIVVLILAGYSMRSNADEGSVALRPTNDEFFHIGIGQSVANSHLKTGEIGYHINDWEFQATLQESGPTRKGRQELVNIYSVSYVTDPGWDIYGVGPYFRLGVSYNDDSPLVGDTNFRLGIGVNFNDVWRVEYSHHSSAGIHDPNTGIDYLTVNYMFSTFW